MRKWQSLGTLVFLASAGACATATNSGAPEGAAGTDSSGATAGDLPGSVGGDSPVTAGTGSTFGGSASVGGQTAFGGTASLGGQTAFGGSAGVGGQTAFGGTAGVGGQTAFGGTAGVGGQTAFGGTASMAGGSSNGGASGAAGAFSGGSSGTSSGGGSAGSGGTSAGGATNTGPCANPKDVSKTSGMFGTLGPVCMRTTETFNTLACYNFAGRTMTVNGTLFACSANSTSKGTFAPPIDGYTYFDVSAGTMAYASFDWYTQ